MLQQVFEWFINVSLKVLKLKKRDSKIWIFGSWNGTRYADNSKYLFKYVQKHLPEIRAVWITKSQQVKEELCKEGKECYLYNEKKARKLRLKAGFLFFTNGAVDVGHYDLCQGAKKIALWHGMPLKRLCYATNNLRKRKKNPVRFIQYCKLKIYSNPQRDFTIATSETSKQFLQECFEGNPETYYITGQPRNDGLFDEQIKDEVRKTVNHKKTEQFILYMPTWRESNKKGKPFLNEVIKALFQEQEFLKELEKRNTKLYIKPHPNVQVDYKTNGNIIILDHSLQLETQALMGAADVLITDYSSAFIDFALTEKPIHFFVPDLEEYAKNRLGLFLRFEDFAPYWHTTLEGLKKTILNEEESHKKGLLNTQKINEIYDDPELIRGKYCEKVLATLRQSYS